MLDDLFNIVGSREIVDLPAHMPHFFRSPKKQQLPIRGAAELF